VNVTLINYTPDALETLIFTKNTRLRMSATGLDEIREWPEEKKAKELEYMKNTIQSSWEFVDYVFLISDVTRAFTHQLVRHRVGTSFAQQAQRAVDMTGFTYETGDSIEDNPNANVEYQDTMHVINQSYQTLIELGAKPQDARGVLPTNIHTNIVFKANLRTLHDMSLKRLCVKAQGEFQDVFREIVERVAEVHPWARNFLRVECAWSGTCLFPSLPKEECHVKPYVYNQFTGLAYDGGKPETVDVIYQIHRDKRTEIQPRVPNSDNDPMFNTEMGVGG
jgi:flavin-dependent thymidylate synthase